MTVCVTYFTGLEATVRYEAETVEELVKLVAAFDEPDDGWIEWHGGKNPVSFVTMVEWVSRNGNMATSRAGNVEWTHDESKLSRPCHIVRYRVVK